MTSAKSAVTCGGNDPAKPKNTMQTITASTPSIKCSLALNTFLTPQKRKSWHFKPNPTVTHTIGSIKTKVQEKLKTKLDNLKQSKEQTNKFLALRRMTTIHGRKCSLNENGKLKIGNRFATKPEQAQFAALIK